MYTNRFDYTRKLPLEGGFGKGWDRGVYVKGVWDGGVYVKGGGQECVCECYLFKFFKLEIDQAVSRVGEG